MKAMFVIFFTLIYGLSAMSQTFTCEGLFAVEPTKAAAPVFESKRLSVIHVNNENAVSKLIIEAKAFSENTDQGTIEIMQMLVQNSDFKLEDKSVLTKNKFTLGVPFKDGYFFELTYESKSNDQPRFVLQDKIILISPTGKESKVTDELLDARDLKVNKSEFNLSGFSETGLQVHLRVPLVVEGDLLARLTEMAPYFEYFKKSEIAAILKNESLAKIKMLFRLGKAKDVFLKVLIKQPFKSLISGVIIFAVINGQAYFPHRTSPHKNLIPAAVISHTYLKTTINNFPIAENQIIPSAENQIKLKSELGALLQKASAQLESKSNEGPGPFDISLGSTNIFSRDHNLFIHNRKNEVTGLPQTYFVFASEVSTGAVQGIQFFPVEVNPQEFQTLIQFLKAQSKIIDRSNLRAGAP